jgi:hypothetical protein
MMTVTTRMNVLRHHARGMIVLTIQMMGATEVATRKTSAIAIVKMGTQ